MAYFLARGRSLSTKRGVVASDSEDPEIRPKDIGLKDPAAAKKALDIYVKKGVLVEADSNPYLPEQAAAVAAHEEKKTSRKDKKKRAKKAAAELNVAAVTRTPASQDGDNSPRVGARPKNEE